MGILLKAIILLFIVTFARTIRKIFLKKKPVTKIERKKIIFNNFVALIILLVILIGGFYYYRTNQINNGIKNRAHRKYFSKSKIDYLIDSYENKNRVNRTKEKQTYDYETNKFSDETMHNNYSIHQNSNNSAYGSDKENQNKSRASINNRSNQINPNNSAYGSSRNSGGGNQGQSRASINNRSNQMNPNHSASKGKNK